MNLTELIILCFEIAFTFMKYFFMVIAIIALFILNITAASLILKPLGNGNFDGPVLAGFLFIIIEVCFLLTWKKIRGLK